MQIFSQITKTLRRDSTRVAIARQILCPALSFPPDIQRQAHTALPKHVALATCLGRVRLGFRLGSEASYLTDRKISLISPEPIKVGLLTLILVTGLSL